MALLRGAHAAIVHVDWYRGTFVGKQTTCFWNIADLQAALLLILFTKSLGSSIPSILRHLRLGVTWVRHSE